VHKSDEVNEYLVRAKGARDAGGQRGRAPVSLYKILFHFRALLWESVILLLPPPTCNA